MSVGGEEADTRDIIPSCAPLISATFSLVDLTASPRP